MSTILSENFDDGEGEDEVIATTISRTQLKSLVMAEIKGLTDIAEDIEYELDPHPDRAGEIELILGKRLGEINRLIGLWLKEARPPAIGRKK